MSSHRQIKITFGNTEFFVGSIQEAIEKTGCSKTSIRNCLNGDTKSCKGYTFKYAQVKPTDVIAKGQKDSAQEVNQNRKCKKIKVTDTSTGQFRISPSRSKLAEEWEVSSSYINKLIKNQTLYKGQFLVEHYSVEDEEEVHFKRAEDAISKVQDGDIRSKLAGLLSQVRYDKFDAVKPRQIREVLPFKQWINDTYYSGPDALNLYPYWKNKLSEVFDSGRNITEFVLAGSIGTGKTTASLYGLMYKLYMLSCYENTAGLFNLMVTSKIAIMYFTINLKQAEKLGYGQLKNMIDNTQYFTDHFPRVQRIITKLIFPENVEITYGSNSNHAIGLNLIASLLDEANFFNESQATDERTVSAVYQLYSSIVARGRSRYLHNGWNHSLCFLVSSSTHVGSFTEKRIAEGRKNNFANMVVAAPRLWDVKPKGTYSDDRFYVFGGNDAIDPFIITNIKDLNTVRGALLLETYPIEKDLEEACKETINELSEELVVPIPTDFRKDFENDIIKALQDIAGYSTSPSGYLFSSRPTYNKCVDLNYVHPFVKDEIEISTNDDTQLWDYLIKNYKFEDIGSPHFISVDASTKNDSTGIAMCHLKSIEYDRFGNAKPIIMIDFMLRITPPLKPYEIDISKIREFIRYLRDEKNIRIEGVSYDQYASTESLQLLRQQGFNAIQQSVIRSDVPHRDFVHLIQEGRLITYKYKPFEQELFNMMHDRIKHKVTIAPGTTEYHGDTYMATIGAVMHLMSMIENLPQTTENLTVGEDNYEDMHSISADDFLENLMDGLIDEDDDFEW